MKICLHKWGKWAAPVDASDGKYQHSACEKCLAITSRKLPYDGSTPASRVVEKLNDICASPGPGGDE